MGKSQDATKRMNSHLNWKQVRCHRLVAFTAAVLTVLAMCVGAWAASAPTERTNNFRLIDLSQAAVRHEGVVARRLTLPKGIQNFHGVPFAIGIPVALRGIDSARAGE